jgi:hypothetical protein
LIASAAEEQPSVGNSYRREDSAIEPGSVISGYPIPPAYTLLRYDEHYSYLADPANRTEPLDVIKYIPLFNWGASYFVTFGRDSSVSLNYYHFYRGGFLTSQTRTKDVDYFSIWISYTF